MSDPWLHIVGIGEDGMAGLTPAARAVVEAAEVIIGGDRHHRLSDKVTAERVAWPSPFDAMIDLIRSHRGRRLVILATGDPLWFSVGARIGRAIDPTEIVYHPHISAFQLASARMGWSMADLETLTVHGRPVEQMIAFIQPDIRLLILTTGADPPAKIAEFLTRQGYPKSPMTVFAAMGGPNEARFDGVAEDWAASAPAFPEFNTLAVECVAAQDAALLPRVPGLPDDAFRHDGAITKREVRAATLAKLMPMRGALLWDVGCGCGSVAIEWMRSGRYARAIGIEPRADRRAMAAENALALGAPKLEIVAGSAPDALAGLPAPDAVFIGGGISEEVLDCCWDALRPLGRLVINAVSIEGQGALAAFHAARGGDLAMISVHRAKPLGPYRGWRPALPVAQWSLIKR